MQFNGQSLGNVTIFMGIANRLNADTNHDLLLKEADNALYQAKEQGRNRALISHPENTPPALPSDEG